MSMRTKIFLGTAMAICLAPLTAHAHWCNDLWSSAYNIVVRPSTDTLTVPASGSANWDIYVQNNMGYQLPSFSLTATMGSTKLTATRETQTTAGVLLPGEKSKYTLAVTKSGGGSVAIGDISFSVGFGNSGQDGLYPAGGGKAVMIRQTDGTLVPAAPPPGIGSGVDQARQLQYAAVADFSDATSGISKLMSFYCAGRGSWGANDATVITPACSGTATDCTKATRSTADTGSGTKYDYTKSWAAIELAARKSGLGANLATLRTRLQCGASDANLSFAGVALMVLGYLGDDPTARTFLAGKAGGTDANAATIAKAALMLFSAADATQYDCSKAGGSTSSNTYVKAACLAALAIANNDDTSAKTLLGMVKWSEPDTDNAAGLYPSHMLSLVAWSRRGWAANGGDVGSVSFYAGGTANPTGGSGSGGTTGAGGATGAGGQTVVASGGAAGTPTGGNIATGGKLASGGGTVAPTGGNSVTPSGGTVMAMGGVAGSPTGGNTGVGAGGNTPAASGGASANPNTGVATGGSQGNGGTSGHSGSTGGVSGTGTGTGENLGQGGESGNGGAPSTGSGTAANTGSAGGCSYSASGRASIPLGFLLAGVGLALATRRRRR